MSKELQEILNVDEKIIWQGKPQALLYRLGAIFGLLFGAIVAVVLYVAVGKIGSGFIPYLVFIIPVAVIIVPSLYRLLVYRYIIYVITDKRVILQGGLIGRDFDFVDYDKVESSSVDVSIFDKIMSKNTGTILIYANRMQPVTNTYRDASGSHSTTTIQNVPFTLSHIVAPYETFNLFKKVSFDIKADINFPNALRPKENEGYATSYDESKK
jgi:hypothetical protein